MNKLILLVLFFFSPMAIAQYDFSSEGSAWGARNYVSVLAEYWSYEELPDIMKDSGGLLGMSYAHKNTSGFLYYEFSIEALYGKTTYEGSTMTTNIPLSFEQTNFMYMGQVWIGAQWDFSASTSVIPKIGYLYRKLTDFDDDVLGDYRRDQEYFVIPLGLDLIIQLSNGNKLGFTAWSSIDFKGKNKTYLTNIGGDRDPSFDQNEGSGFYLEGNYIFDMYTVGGYLRSWQVEDSETGFATLPPPTGAGLFHEPKNETWAVGFKASVMF